MAELAIDRNEFCPSCGVWVETLEPEFGWCSECSSECHPDYKFNKQKWEMFLADHADRIEELMSQGIFLTAAMKIIRDEIRPNCVVCNESLKGGKRNALFCRKHTNIYFRYRRFKQKGMDHNDALQKALNVDTRNSD